MINFDERAVEIVRNYIKEKGYFPTSELFIVWSCYILGNRKFLVGMTRGTKYFEVTYNALKNEWYLDAYKKFENRYIKES